MQEKKKILTTEWIYIILAWIAIYYFYFIIAFWGISDYYAEGILKRYLNHWYVHFELISGSMLFGLFFCLINFYTDKTSIRRKSFGNIIFIKSLLYLLTTTIVFLMIYGGFYLLKIGPFKYPEALLVIVNAKFIISWFLYYVFAVVLITFLIQINKKIGPGNLIKLITGKYHKPRDEERIFIFLDLRNSTTIAEKLGHNKYSRLLQNCYHDLTDLVIKYKAEIYQYVGDEVVLSWDKHEKISPVNSIRLFYDYKNKLLDRKSFYLKYFDVFPEFKGGIDAGIVTVAEVGDIKREIAYHGDVLNTAARIQDKCREYDKDLLISENYGIQIREFNDFTKKLIGEVSLKGKKQTTKIYSVELK